MSDREMRDALLEWTLLDARSAAWWDLRQVRDWRWTGHVCWPIAEAPLPVAEWE
jgi:hypothetical protein